MTERCAWPKCRRPPGYTFTYGKAQKLGVCAITTETSFKTRTRGCSSGPERKLECLCQRCIRGACCVPMKMRDVRFPSVGIRLRWCVIVRTVYKHRCATITKIGRITRGMVFGIISFPDVGWHPNQWARNQNNRRNQRKRSRRFQSPKKR